MKRFIISALLIFSSLDNVSANDLDLKIDGIGLETKENIVLRKFGKPLSRKQGGMVPCSEGAKRLLMRYPGLEIEFYLDSDQKEFSVYSLKVTSSKWSVNEINIGADIADVQQKFGEPYLKRTEKNILGTYYNLTDGAGAAEFYFQRHKLKEISWEINFC